MSAGRLEALDPAARKVFAAMADHLIPEAHGMPSAGDVVDDTRLRFVLGTRPDLVEPLSAALRAELGTDPATRLAHLQHDEPERYGALTFTIVAGYYTDANVRQLIGYPGQQRIPPDPNAREAYLDEGLIDQVIARGPVWKDPATGRRAEQEEPT